MYQHMMQSNTISLHNWIRILSSISKNKIKISSTTVCWTEQSRASADVAKIRIILLTEKFRHQSRIDTYQNYSTKIIRTFGNHNSRVYRSYYINKVSWTVL